MKTENAPQPGSSAAPTCSPRVSRVDRCCTCGRPRGLTQRRASWGLQCPTVIVPRTNNPDDKPWQITNDLIYTAAVWRNGGSDETTHVCDDCIRVGLRAIKLKVDELLGEIEANADKDAELALLTQRLGDLQFHHQSLVYEHNRMQERLAKVLELVPGNVAAEAVKFARWEVVRGPMKNHWGAPDADAENS